MSCSKVYWHVDTCADVIWLTETYKVNFTHNIIYFIIISWWRHATRKGCVWVTPPSCRLNRSTERRYLYMENMHSKPAMVVSHYYSFNASLSRKNRDRISRYRILSLGLHSQGTATRNVQDNWEYSIWWHKWYGPWRKRFERNSWLTLWKHGLICAYTKHRWMRWNIVTIATISYDMRHNVLFITITRTMVVCIMLLQ